MSLCPDFLCVVWVIAILSAVLLPAGFLLDRKSRKQAKGEHKPEHHQAAHQQVEA